MSAAVIACARCGHEAKTSQLRYTHVGVYVCTRITACQKRYTEKCQQQLDQNTHSHRKK